MAKVFSFASWNVEALTNAKSSSGRITEFISESGPPDVFAIFEVKGSQVFMDFMTQMPTHQFFITEDLGPIEILIGVNRDLRAFLTQKVEFKSQIPTLRPGALLTLHTNSTFYSLLFLHLKSFPDPRSWGLRDDMITHVRNLKGALDKAQPDPELGARFLALGDLNTMGMNLPHSTRDEPAPDEIERYEAKLAYRDMRRLSKSHPATWWNGKDTWEPSDLDHAFASDNLKFKTFAGGAEIEVRGWPELGSAAEQKEWIEEHSDHALLYGEVHE
ncbi:MAG TPA: endonuclease/exonuclease/phosphatase family protein [Longimicrobiales bacterium]|nr:endonuclease/exonuclease/phosphatase family protein [Longimicrobiales bacterium]